MAVGEWELWACAQKVIDQHGSDALAHAERRMTELLAEGDEAGALTWTGIEARIVALRLRSPPAVTH